MLINWQTGNSVKNIPCSLMIKKRGDYHMTKQEFKELCDRILKRYGFVKARGHYYLDLGSDVLGAVLFQASDYGAAYYLNCGFSIKSEMAPRYPKLTDVTFCHRIAVPSKEKYTYFPAAACSTTAMIAYEEYRPEEIEPYIDQALSSWVVPAIKNGKNFILRRNDLYSEMVHKARVLHKFDE